MNKLTTLKRERAYIIKIDYDRKMFLYERVKGAWANHPESDWRTKGIAYFNAPYFKGNVKDLETALTSDIKIDFVIEFHEVQGTMKRTIRAFLRSIKTDDKDINPSMRTET